MSLVSCFVLNLKRMNFMFGIILQTLFNTFHWGSGLQLAYWFQINTVKPVMRGHLSGYLNCIFSGPNSSLTMYLWWGDTCHVGPLFECPLIRDIASHPSVFKKMTTKWQAVSHKKTGYFFWYFYFKYIKNVTISGKIFVILRFLCQSVW